MQPSYEVYYALAVLEACYEVVQTPTECTADTDCLTNSCEGGYCRILPEEYSFAPAVAVRLLAISSCDNCSAL